MTPEEHNAAIWAELSNGDYLSQEPVLNRPWVSRDTALSYDTVALIDANS